MATDPIRVLSYGGGVQSTCLLHMSLRGDEGLERVDHVVFADTGWEPASAYRHVDATERLCEADGVTFHRVRAPGDGLRADLIRAATVGGRIDSPPLFTAPHDGGRRGMSLRKCTRHYKSRPIDRLITRLRRAADGAHIEQWFGISLDEIERMRLPDRRKRDWLTYRYPLAWDLRYSRARCVAWMEEHDVAHPPKSACLGCPYHSDAQWRWVRDQTDPGEWGDTVRIDRLLRATQGIDGLHGQAYLHSSCLPLDEAPIDADASQLALGFVNDCEGYCGV